MKKDSNKNLVKKIGGTAINVVNIFVPVKKSGEQFKEALKFKRTRQMLNQGKIKKVDYIPFEELCQRNDIDDSKLKKRYMTMAWLTYVFFFAMVGWGAYFIMSILNGDVFAAIRSFSTTIVCLSFYFWAAVDAYCYRTRQLHSKLGFLKSPEHIFPNPFHEFSEVSEVIEEGKSIRKIKAFLLSKIN